MDRISIRDLRVDMRIGVTDEERAMPRSILITVDIWTDATLAGRSDELSDTIDYHAATIDIAAMVRSTEAKLLEHVAEKIASLVKGLPGAEGVMVELTKESPPIDEDVRAVSVRIDRPAQ